MKQEEQAAIWAADFFGVKGSATCLNGYRDRNFRIDANGKPWVLKVLAEEVDSSTLGLWVEASERLSKAGIRVPRPAPTLEGKAWAEIPRPDGGRNLAWLTEWVEGEPIAGIKNRPDELHEQVGKLVAQAQAAFSGWDAPALDRVFDWDLRQGKNVVEKNLARIAGPRDQRVIHETLACASEALADIAPHLQAGPIHGDPNDFNVLVDGESSSLGLIDFEDLSWGWLVGDLAISAAYMVLGQKDPAGVLASMAKGYHGVSPIPEKELPALWPLAKLRMCVSITMAAKERALDPDNEYISVSTGPGLDFLRRALRISGDEVLGRLRKVCGFSDQGSPSTQEDLASRRRKALGPNLSLSYRTPLHIVRGAGRYLIESGGRAFLDGVNNVPHVGHSHPKVVDAVARQMRRLNTNTRYLNEIPLAFAENLASTLPDPLSVVFLVNSGSEANELALRLARAHSGGSDWVVLDAAYHGNTGALVDLSPYKFGGKGGAGKPPHVEVAALPDRYRGEWGYDDPDAGAKFAADLDRCLQSITSRGGKAAGFLAEAIPGCAGQVVLPPGYLESAYEKARAAGAVCIADEVQVGFGRVGTHFWAFETQAVVPDIVTMGKPIGNGHPLGAVVTTPAIAASFDTGMEYFNTFGGNPVACAAGNAVLEIIQEEGLQENALRTGKILLDGLQELAERHPLFGDVRGLGLFLGAVCVQDFETKEPATEEATRLVEALREDGILLSTDGPLHDVIKIKPPLVFEEDDARYLLERLAAALP